MKINFKKLKQLEDEFTNNPVSLRTLRDMIEMLLSGRDSNSEAYRLAYDTLKDLEILEINKDKKNIQQLNS